MLGIVKFTTTGETVAVSTSIYVAVTAGIANVALTGMTVAVST